MRQRKRPRNWWGALGCLLATLAAGALCLWCALWQEAHGMSEASWTASAQMAGAALGMGMALTVIIWQGD